MPRLANDRAFLRLYAAHRNYPQMQYYGPGPDSNKGARSNYRLEDTSYDFETGIRPFRNMNLGVTGGYLQVNVGPGTNTRYISTERIFNEFTTPGITQQSDFLRGGVFAQYDFRDNVGGPRRGGNYFAEFSYYDDRDLGRHDHRRLHMEAQQYIPFFNERRVIALRAASTLTYANRGQRVPFYLQPVIGGGDTVRGYRPFRFHDDNSILLNGEYRWEVFSGMDMAIFADAGKVFRNKRQWNLHDLESSVGVGLRFNVRNDVFMRLDSGFSHEGFQVWVKFNNIF
jgi:outer membrane protein assembly factor BamA